MEIKILFLSGPRGYIAYWRPHLGRSGGAGREKERSRVLWVMALTGSTALSNQASYGIVVGGFKASRHEFQKLLCYYRVVTAAHLHSPCGCVGHQGNSNGLHLAVPWGCGHQEVVVLIVDFGVEDIND